MVQIKRPLDFEAVTDHAEYMGAVRLANDPQSDMSKLPIADKLKVKSKEDIQKIYLFLGTSILKNEPIKELTSPEVAGSVWKRIVEIADKYYQPGKFTTFAAYEWTLDAGQSQPAPQHHLQGLRRRFRRCRSARSIRTIRRTCGTGWTASAKRATSCLAISHNANLSDGVMFPLEVDSKGRPIDAAWAQSRVNNEPLSEIQQLKGASETHPALSPNDEFAGHEILDISARRRRARAEACTAATSARRTRTAWRCRTLAATTRTSSASSAPATRTARPPPIPNRTISAVTACSTPRRRPA